MLIYCLVAFKQATSET